MPKPISECPVPLPPVRRSILRRAIWHSVLLTAFTTLLLSVTAFIKMQAFITHIAFRALYATPGEGPKILHDALQGVHELTLLLTGLGFLILLFAAALAFVLARQLTQPIRILADRMRNLGPGKWNIKRDIHSGDEVEQLESVTADMAARLRILYEHLEEEVRARTEELKAQYVRDRSILENIEHGIILVDTHGRITDANPAAEHVLQCTTQCPGFSVIDMFLFYEDGQRIPQNKHPVRQCLTRKVTVKSKPGSRYTVERPDHTMLPVNFIITPVLARKKLLGAVVVFQDVTEERRVDYLKTEFIALASHQLRTPLSMIEWYLELLEEEGSFSIEQKEYLKEMGAAARRMASLIDALMRAAHIEGGGIKAQHRKINFTHLIDDLVEEFRSLAKNRKISCVAEVPKGSILTSTDAVLLHVVFKNLFSNAVKYTQPGGEVGVRMRKLTSSIEVTVHDTGIGIPKADQPRIFQRLFRAHNAQTIDTDGNGLGLYISKMIIGSLGGEISFESTEGKGSAFTVRLPLKGKGK